MIEKWTINRLNEETGLDRRTLKKILQETDPCDFDGKSELYRMTDFIKALRIYDAPRNGGNMEDAKLRLVQEQTRLTGENADIAAVEKARVRNEVIETSTVFNVWESVAVSIRRTILTSGMSQDRIDACLNELRSLKIEDFMEQQEFDSGTPAEAV
jgi:phage terminase Nu1 subunit (DNA packaging protein)